MIFIAKEADFSANNIGKVILDYSDLTKNVLNAFDQNALSTTQKDALDTLFTTLTVNGMLSKIVKLYMPVLAKDKNKAFINIVDQNLTNDIPTVPASISLLNNGINNVGKSDYLMFNYSAALKTSDIHFLEYNTLTAVVGTNVNICGFSNQWDGDDAFRAIPGTQNNWYIDMLKLNNLSFSPSGGINDFNPAPCLKGFSMYPSMDVTKTPLYNPELQLVTSPTTNDNSAINKTSFCLTGYNRGFNNISQGLISFGYGLTPSEVAIYQSLTNAFMAAMGISGIHS